MVVGICRLVLALPWNDSLKGKRSVVKSIVERARQRFQVSAAEIEDLDNHRRATLGFAVVSNDARHAQSILDKLIGFVASATQAEVIDRASSVEHYDLGALSLGGERWDNLGWDEHGDDEEE